MLIPLISIIVVAHALPALLGGIGPRIDWPRIRKEDQASRAWSAWAAGVVRRRGMRPPSALVVLVVLFVPVFGLKVGETCADALAKTGPAHAAYRHW